MLEGSQAAHRNGTIEEVVCGWGKKHQKHQQTHQLREEDNCPLRGSEGRAGPDCCRRKDKTGAII